MGTSYRDDPAAIRALVQPDRVHRDLYIDPELFALADEQGAKLAATLARHALA